VTKNLIIALAFFIAGHVLSWYSSNSQFISEWWKDRAVLICCVMAIPCALVWLYGIRFMMAHSPELWKARFIAFSLSYLTFPLLTWYHLGESPFTLKTIICTLLAFTIVIVQLLMK
jgi:hypothetical protein